MKYMGSKRTMLRNGLGELLVARAAKARRVVDLFAGTGAVSWHVAERCEVPVVAVDLQQYAVTLAGAVTTRTNALDARTLHRQWIEPARDEYESESCKQSWRSGSRLERADVEAERRLSSGRPDRHVSLAYGGYYFSHAQARAIDTLLAHLPTRGPRRTTCVAALIEAVSRCAAAPGHTAQPFQPTDSALPFIESAWRRDVFDAASAALSAICPRHALVKGAAIQADGSEMARKKINEHDLVFLDPPYSAAQYSRFYHVLETVAHGECGPVSGVGRYPASDRRPRSTFSLKSAAPKAIADLLGSLGAARCEVVMTFPQYGSSNGIVGEDLVALAREWFHVDVDSVATRYSTLGGNNNERASRMRSMELILAMRPR